ncbi:hypothetical protein BS78_01G139200 [Paspalum vaginatum]|nr:hypothetical protein BS78_01G139200 [Paspalum vaginatum]
MDLNPRSPHQGPLIHSAACADVAVGSGSKAPPPLLHLCFTLFLVAGFIPAATFIHDRCLFLLPHRSHSHLFYSLGYGYTTETYQQISYLPQPGLSGEIFMSRPCITMFISHIPFLDHVTGAVLGVDRGRRYSGDGEDERSRRTAGVRRSHGPSSPAQGGRHWRTEVVELNEAKGVGKRQRARASALSGKKSEEEAGYCRRTEDDDESGFIPATHFAGLQLPPVAFLMPTASFLQLPDACRAVFNGCVMNNASHRNPPNNHRMQKQNYLRPQQLFYDCGLFPATGFSHAPPRRQWGA